MRRRNREAAGARSSVSPATGCRLFHVKHSLHPDPAPDGDTESLLAPTAPAEVSYRVKNSRFIAVLRPVRGREEVEDALEELWDHHPEATHIVYAFAVGPPRSRSFGQSDDGEPKGTAGRPVLSVLDGRGITNALVAVIRYFGGTRLGTGGLVHAYGDGARRVLDGASFAPLRRMCAFRLRIEYALQSSIREGLSVVGALVAEEVYDTAVEIRGTVPAEREEELRRELRDRSRGAVEPELGEPYWG